MSIPQTEEFEIEIAGDPENALNDPAQVQQVNGDDY